MSVQPTPALRLSGVDVAAGPDPDGSWPAVMVLGGVSVKWGRSGVLEQPTAATATVSLFDPSGSWAATRELIGQPVELRWTAGATTRVYFTGRVGAVGVDPTTVTDPAGNRVHGATVTLSCASLLADLGNRTPPAGGWPAETLAARRTRLAGLAAGPVAAIGTRPAWDLAPLAPVAQPEGGSVLDALTAFLANAGADRWTYDPATRTVDWLGRRVFAPATLARLTRDSTRVGVYVTGPTVTRGAGDTPAPAVSIPAGVVEYDGGVSKALESKLTRATVTWADPASTPTAYAAATTVVLVPGTDEATIGVRSADLTTQLAGSSQALAAATDAAALAGGEAAGWALEAMRWNTRRTGGFDSLDQAELLLAGAERTGVFWLSGSLLPTLGVLPLFGVCGGTIGYARGGWEVTWNAAPTAPSGPLPAGISADDLDPSIVWDDHPNPAGLHASVTCEDLRFVAAGTILIGA